MFTYKEETNEKYFSGVRVVRSLVFCVMFCMTLYFRLSFFFLLFYCLSYFDLRRGPGGSM